MPKLLKKGSFSLASTTIVAEDLICSGRGNNVRGCDAHWEVYQADIFQTEHTAYRGDTTYFITFQCPACNVLTDINDDYVDATTLPKQKDMPAFVARQRLLESISAYVEDCSRQGGTTELIYKTLQDMVDETT